MASKTAEKFKVNRGTAGGDSFYVTDVTTLADGSVKRETYRSDNKGNNKRNLIVRSFRSLVFSVPGYCTV